MKLKKLFPLFMFTIFLALSACGQTQDTEFGTAFDQTETSAKESLSDGGQDTLVWRVRLPLGAYETEQFNTVADIWQESLNAILKEKGAEYTVQIKPLGLKETTAQGTADVSENTVNITEELEALKDAEEQTDLISIRAPEMYGDLKGYYLVYSECAGRGLLKPLDSLLESEQGQAIKAAVTQTDLDRAKIEGQIYGLSAVLPPIGYTAYSTEQMQKYKITEEELLTPIFENEALIEKVRDLSGEAPYGILSGDVRYELGLWLVEPTETMVLGKDGVFVSIAETPEFRERLELLLDWKEKGLLQIIEGLREDMCFAQNSIGENFSAQPYHAELSVSVGIGPELRCPVFVVPDPAMWSLAPYWGDSKQCIASWSKKQEQASDFLVRLMTDPDIANLIQYGRKGQEYTIEDQKAQVPRRTNIYLSLFGGQYTNPLLTWPTPVMTEDKREYAAWFHETCESYIPDGFRFDPVPVIEQIAATNQVFADGSGSFAAANIRKLAFEDVDQVIAKLAADLKAAGMDEIVAEANRQLKEWKEESLDAEDEL